jgi:thioredoxin-related protein
MRKIMVLALLSMWIWNPAAGQEEVKWYSIDEAIALSMNEPRIMVIDVYTDWCGWCKRMDATTFSDQEVVRSLNEHFYPVKLNAEGKADITIGDKTYKFVDNGRRGYHEVAAIVTNGRLAYPTISYLDGQGKILKVAPGYKDADGFKQYLTFFAEDHYKNQTFEEFQAANAPEAPATPPM